MIIGKLRYDSVEQLVKWTNIISEGLILVTKLFWLAVNDESRWSHTDLVRTTTCLNVECVLSTISIAWWLYFFVSESKLFG